MLRALLERPGVEASARRTRPTLAPSMSLAQVEQCRAGAGGGRGRSNASTASPARGRSCRTCRRSWRRSTRRRCRACAPTSCALATLGQERDHAAGRVRGAAARRCRSNRRLRAWDIASASQRSRMDLLLGAAAAEGRTAAGGALAEDPGLARRQRPADRAGDAGAVRSRGRSRAPSAACASPKCNVISGGENVALARQSHAVEHRRRRRDRRTARARHRQQDRHRAQGGDRPRSRRSNGIRGGKSIWANRGRSNRSRSGMPRPATTEAPPLHVSVLDSSRRPVFAQELSWTASPVERVVIGGDVTDAMVNAAIVALAAVPGREAERFGLLARHIQNAGTRRAAIAAIRTIPQERWPTEQLAPVSDALLTYIRSVPPAERTNPAFKEAVELGTRRRRAAAGRGGQGRHRRDRQAGGAHHPDRDAGGRDEVQPSGVHGRSRRGNRDRVLQPRPDAAQPGGDGARARSSRSASRPRRWPRKRTPSRRTSCPTTPEVLYSTRLINTGETARLRFTVPTRTGSYPYVCTFPGHWRTMNGLMQVVRAGTTLPGR